VINPGKNLQPASLAATFETTSQAVDFESVREEPMWPVSGLLRSIASGFNPKALKHFALTIRLVKLMVPGHCEQPIRLNALLHFQGNTELNGATWRDHSRGVRVRAVPLVAIAFLCV